MKVEIEIPSFEFVLFLKGRLEEIRESALKKLDSGLEDVYKKTYYSQIRDIDLFVEQLPDWLQWFGCLAGIPSRSDTSASVERGPKVSQAEYNFDSHQIEFKRMI